MKSKTTIYASIVSQSFSANEQVLELEFSSGDDLEFKLQQVKHLYNCKLDSVSNVRSAIYETRLQRAKGTFQIDSLMYDKEDCSGWTVDNIKKLLGCLRRNGGVGLDEEDASSVKLKGSTLENIVDALLSFNGDEEAKIEHAVKEIDCEAMVAQSIVRWVFSNLLEYK